MVTSDDVEPRATPQSLGVLAAEVCPTPRGLRLNKILGTIHTYPTLAEANKCAAGEWKRAHQPHGLLPWVQKLHDWRRA